MFFKKLKQLYELRLNFLLFGVLILWNFIPRCNKTVFCHFKEINRLLHSNFFFLFLFPLLSWFQSVSAFAPIANPINCPWGQKAFTNYLGGNKSGWEVILRRIRYTLYSTFKFIIFHDNNFDWKLQDYDATCLITKARDVHATILIDQVT